MKKNIYNELEKKITGEEIVLPESLSAENIERLINEKGGIIEPKRKRNHKVIKAAKWCSAAAAAIVLLVGIGAVIESSTSYVTEQKQEQVIEDHVAESDYSEIENAVLTYFQELYNSRKSDNGFVFSDLFDGADVENSASGSAEPGDFATGTALNGMLQESKTSHSETNTQVEGVDEADIIKNDGRYIYYLTENRVLITDCADVENMKIVSEIELFEEDTDNYMYASEMFFYGGKLAVIMQVEADTREYTPEESYTTADGYTVVTDICYCYAPNFDTVVKIYDISDIEKPKLDFEQKVNGDYLSSRMIGGKLLTVTRYDIPYNYIDSDNFEDSCTVLKDNCIPAYSVNGGSEVRIVSDRIKLLNEEDPASYVITSIIDINDTSKEPYMNAYLGSGYEMYCTSENLYIASVEYGGYDSDNKLSDSNGEQFYSVTHIYKHKITNEGVEYIDCVTVGGTMINQFAMDESNGNLRVATNGSKINNAATGTVVSTSTQSMVYIVGSDMKIKGFVGDIAHGEDMKSARFMGNMLYLVTFFQTDPLFVIDLSDETAPKVEGELKIPGFSSYLHPIGNGLVIGIGEGGTMSGTDGTAKFSLFDVSDPTSPKELDNYTTSTIADFIENHKAFVTIDENTYAVPLVENYDSEKIMVFSIENGGIIVDNIYYCHFGEIGYESVRCAFIGDTLLAVNINGIYAFDMISEEKIGEVDF